MAKKPRLPLANERFDPADWCFERSIEGQQTELVRLDWAFDVPGGTKFTDPEHSYLRNQLGSFIRVAMEETAGIRMDVGSLPATFMGIRELATFMVKRNIDSVALLTSELSWEYIEELEEQYIEGSFDERRPRAWTHSVAYKLIHPLTQIYAVGAQLRAENIDSLPEPPFDGKATFAVVEDELGLKRGGGLAPIPDRVAIPVLSRAYEWIEYGSDDVIHIQTEFLRRRAMVAGKKGAHRAAGYAEIGKFLRDYEMAIVPETGQPWHESLLPRRRIDDNGNVVEVSTVQSVRRLVLNTIAAATICIQGCTGLRAHEMIGLKVSKVCDPLLGLVTLSASADELMEVFSINGTSRKRDATVHSWTAGLRPAGTSHQPIPVKAIEVLIELLAPWRAMKGRGAHVVSNLLLTFTQSKSLPASAGQVGRMTAMRSTALQREFAADVLVARYGISIEEAWQEVRSIRPLRWRKTFANYVFRTKPTLLSALRDHYRHLSERITERGYIGSDVSLIEDLQGERELEAARLFTQIYLGKPVGAGPAHSMVMKHAADVAANLTQMEGESVLDRARAYVDLTGFRMWTSTYASCLINILPSESSCNPDASLLPGWEKPNFGLRSPTLCASCRCCLILPEHRDFWAKRMVDNQKIVDEEKQMPRTRPGRTVASQRVAQSRAILKHLDEVSASESADSV